mmetsp:Transcript_946/g.1234  ORF Transcript_946/g.1234 Transcript_946/m.1234 type:complete len:138 (-) Transcript_946:662-1075(-)|eukprot:CAMPEP_0116061558 /NCGR_PEP_ID=MMETSP0322-20121206/7159_1 /TAXON_ID=163516 /ORGANISM="Leptocylindrus danicus var. apora, Strain B651" /LENGTH=137 /DNA_ID=CAMNT_0003546545 /DNA_START=159 /DNA_END=572 /DNA_ORIENTATION=-
MKNYIRMSSLNLQSFYKNEHKLNPYDDGDEKKKKKGGFFLKRFSMKRDSLQSGSLRADSIDSDSSRPDNSVSPTRLSYQESRFHEDALINESRCRNSWPPPLYHDPRRRPYIGGFAAAAYEAARDDYILSKTQANRV